MVDSVETTVVTFDPLAESWEASDQETNPSLKAAAIAEDGCQEAMS